MSNQRPEPKIVKPEDIDPRHDWNRPLMALGQRQQARDPRRLLEHWRRRIKSDPGRARKARHALCRRVSQRKWRVRQSRQAVQRSFGPESGLRQGRGPYSGICSSRCFLCRRWGVGAGLQDRPQRHAWCGYRKPDRNHASGTKGRGAAACVSRIYE